MKPSEVTHKRIQPALGSWFEITVSSASGALGSREDLCSDVCHAAMTAAFSEVRRLERIFSIFQSESEVSALNRARCGEPLKVLPELNHVLNCGQALEMESRRAFRLMPECPHDFGNCYQLGDATFTRLGEHCRLDLGGIAKGAIVDHVFAFLSEKLPSSLLTVSAGGDLRSSIADSVQLRINTAQGFQNHSFPGVPGSIATSSRSAHESSLAQYPQAQLREATSASEAAPVSATVQARSCLVADAITKVALFGNLSEISFQKWGVFQVIEFDRSGCPQKVHS